MEGRCQTMPEIEERVSTLEGALMKLAYMQVTTQINLNNLSSLIQELGQGMNEFKRHNQTSMDEFKLHVQFTTDSLSQEMKEFKRHSQASMDEFKLHVQSTTDSLSQEVKEFKEELRRDTKEMKKEINNQWERMAKKMGTLVEDIVIPNIEFIAEKYFNLKTGDIFTRIKKYNPVDKSEQREFDVIAIYTDKIILVEAKSNPKSEEAKEFIDLIKGGEFFKYFPEYAEKKLIPIFASFHIPENVLKKLSKNKIYAMGIKEDTMDILNQELFNSRDV